jgi:hypothetical protein
MSRIIIPEHVRIACEENTNFRRAVERVRLAADAQIAIDADPPQRLAVGNSSAYGETARRFASTGIGGCDLPPAIPGCFGPDNQRICDMQRVSRGVIVTGGLPFTLQMEPSNSAWFAAYAVRATVTDAQNADLNHRVLFTSVTRNGVPLESTNIVPGVAPALLNGTQFDGWWSDDWQDPDAYAVGVSWGWYSDLANKAALRISGIAFALPADTIIAVVVTTYGNAAPTLPPGVTLPVP